MPAMDQVDEPDGTDAYAQRKNIAHDR